MPGAFGGALQRRYGYVGYVDLSALPGTVTQQQHDADTDTTAPEANRERAYAPAGGGAQPYEWLSGQVPVGTGDLASDDPDADNHSATGSHAGRSGGGMARPVGQDPDRAARSSVPQHRPETLDDAGAGGAAFGGLVKTGSMDPIANPGGVDLGHRYKHPADEHRQNLHFNRPGLRIIRAPGRTSAEYTSFSEGGGPTDPKLRRQLRPAGQANFGTVDAAPAAAEAVYEREHGTIGGGWAL